MKKTCLHSFSIHVLLAIFLAAGIGGLWAAQNIHKSQEDYEKAVRDADTARKEADDQLTKIKAEAEQLKKDSENAKIKMAWSADKEAGKKEVAAAVAKQEEAEKKVAEAQKKVDEAAKKFADVDSNFKAFLANPKPLVTTTAPTTPADQPKTTFQKLADLLSKKPLTPEEERLKKEYGPYYDGMEKEALIRDQEDLRKQIDIAKKTNNQDALKKANDQLAYVNSILDTKHSPISWVLKNPKSALAAGGGILIGLPALLSGIITELAQAGSEISQDFKEFSNRVKNDWGIDLGLGNGTIVPSPSNLPPDGDEDYDKTLTEIARLFLNFNKDLKAMMETNKDYASSSIIKIEVGKINVDGKDIAVGIEYNLETTDVGRPLVPVLITLYPQEIRGYALPPEFLLNKIDELGTTEERTETFDEAKQLLSLVLNPTASFVFILKAVQLCNAAANDSTKNDIAKIEYMLDEMTELYSRFILSRDEDISPDVVTSYFGAYTTISEILTNKKVKMYKKLVEDIAIPLDQQKTAFIDIPNPELVEGSLNDALQVFYNHFSQIYFNKFPGDYGYEAPDYKSFGNRALKNYLQATCYRDLKNIMTADNEMADAEGKVTLRKLDGTTYEVNPTLDFKNLMTEPASKVDVATNTLKGAISAIKQLVDSAKAAKKAVETKSMDDAKAAYQKALSGVKSASGTAVSAMLTLRKKNAPYYPQTSEDGTINQTPAEFIIASIKQLRELNQTPSSTLTTLLAKVYAPFKAHIGLTEAQLLGTASGTKSKVSDAISTIKTAVPEIKKTISDIKQIAAPAPQEQEMLPEAPAEEVPAA